MAGRDKEPGARPRQPKGEIFFDSIEAPPHHTASARAACRRGRAASGSSAGPAVGPVMTGLARAAFDRAVGRLHQHRQGGAPPAGHRPVPHRPGSSDRAFRGADKAGTAGSVTDPHRKEGHHRGDH
ncbi:hypothetical protein [Streptomyces sp. VNUA24]|uniref:hypothetical protein n=1 Tax=Streptomyces sp. VNUA24 TaxID=3031131 RepID=UPI0023B81E89|nr:hypothetical protein [Streptomyces sp. VNUA24]WEH13177.1 hypothetical protein PYR72_05490 [Streptomyces sp. VNUA24]